MPKKVSVVVPCYNASQYLDKCITQLLHQTIGLDNLEIILVDDASTDDGKTWGLIAEYEQRFPDTVMAISLEQNMRQGGARNVGISYASGEYLIFCDADDWLLEETLEHCYREAVAHDADVVEFLGTNVTDHDALVEAQRGGKNRLVELDTEQKRKEFLLHIDEEFSFGSQTKLYRASLIQENRIAFAEHLIFEEPSFVVPVRLYEKRHYFLDERLYVWYLSPGSSMRSDWGDHKWDNLKVWLYLAADLEQKGMWKKYYPELECLFFDWEMGLSIQMLLQKGYTLTKESLQLPVNMLLKLFPDVGKNMYIRNRKKNEWTDFLLTLVRGEITDNSLIRAEEVLRKYGVMT